MAAYVHDTQWFTRRTAVLFAIIALLMWINDANRAWQIASLVSIFVSVSLRIVGKAKELWED